MTSTRELDDLNDGFSRRFIRIRAADDHEDQSSGCSRLAVLAPTAPASHFELQMAQRGLKTQKKFVEKTEVPFEI